RQMHARRRHRPDGRRGDLLSAGAGAGRAGGAADADPRLRRRHPQPHRPGGARPTPGRRADAASAGRTVMMATPPLSPAELDVASVRRDFPILTTQVHGKPLIYLDNAATTQKPQAVLDRLTRYYTRENANVHRGVHLLSERATDAYED